MCKRLRLLVLVLACAFATVLEGPVAQARAQGACRQEMPAELAGFRLTRVVDYEKDSLGLGWGYSYSCPDVAATCYGYGLRLQGSGPGPEGLRQHFEQVKNDVLRYRTDLDVRQTAPDDTIEVRGLKVLHAAFAMVNRTERGAMPLSSHVYLTWHGGCFLKLRITYPAEAKVPERRSREFIQALFELWGR